ncbi:MAG: RimK family protein [Methylicorpusculum sp.]|uniref:RimK family protein n=2 Tax=Methylicorpusculum sp. TaxID=2713644 RepID=UPI00271CB03E|nr:RimK family protein [Methylicorpusculum sp.]MDO8844922.1 RimK family protein [Methylicorpusculum sp.]MDO8941015.1 RimK family protein [Methylicorpusculum sp.]MDP2178705.1 RimK family protein [Methylicorpusculum sp.]MDP2203563.1 RimK family protein [Methylicorpusculum sp.]MDP3527973.1 RimK family protein [Methylicorpusculum sp.]
MHSLYIVVDHLQDWAPYFPSSDLITVEDYLSLQNKKMQHSAQVINLCRDYDYLGTGYYCSLLAEARGQRVIPSIRSINDLANHHYYRLYDNDLDKYLGKHLEKCGQAEAEELKIKIFFGKTCYPPLEKMARRLFELYPCPILEVDFKHTLRWEITGIEPGNLASLSEDEQNQFASAIDAFSRKIWRKPKSRKRYRFDMAILCNAEEELPPSDSKAIKNFIRVGNELGVDIDIINKHDFARLPEYDALFIRETTAINHYTYRFAKRAESEGLVVMDDPDSILKCANKVFLADLFATHSVETPKTELLLRNKVMDFDALEQMFSYPVVLKIPHGSFSRGVVKAHNRADLVQHCQELFNESAILLLQEYVLTDYDWRIGFLNYRPIYACKYFMARGHWQIYNHSSDKLQEKSGGFATMAIHEVPKEVIKTATKAVKLIGDGLYGVDLKQVGERNVIIEINDNPSIDSGVEDLYLGDDLYRIIMDEFIRRMERKHSAYP